MQYRKTISLLIVLVIILASIVVVQYQAKKAAALPYTIGSAVPSMSDMPPGMVMKTFPMPTAEPVPTIAMTITKDSMNGYNVHAITTNFTFTPEQLDGPAVPGAGHVHLYIDNHLIIMLGDWYHIDALAPGTHTIKVGLFNNDHSAYSVNGMNIQASQTITVQ
jgi:hypothetical protein